MKPHLMQSGDKIKFEREKQSYEVQATSNRYSVCTKPFNAQKTVLYTIIDWREQIRGTENLIFGMGAETQEQCYEMLVRLLDGESEVSYRNRVPLDIEWVRNGVDGKDLKQAEAEIKEILGER